MEYIVYCGHSLQFIHLQSQSATRINSKPLRLFKPAIHRFCLSVATFVRNITLIDVCTFPTNLTADVIKCYYKLTVETQDTLLYKIHLILDGIIQNLSAYIIKISCKRSFTLTHRKARYKYGIILWMGRRNSKKKSNVFFKSPWWLILQREALIKRAPKSWRFEILMLTLKRHCQGCTTPGESLFNKVKRQNQKRQ